MLKTCYQSQDFDLTHNSQGTWFNVLVVGGGALKQYFSSQAEKSLMKNKIQMADNGKQGLSALDMLSHYPELLFLNVFMPDMDGIEFLAALRKRNYGGGVILVDDVDDVMLNVANEYAQHLGLNVLRAFNSFQLESINWGS